MTKRLGLLAIFAVMGCIGPVGRAAAADILCPDVAQEKNATPGDVAGVQADIERLNLCVERAKLLKQLDDIAGQRQEMLSHVNGGLPGGDAMSMGGTGGIPPMPLSALPSLPPENRTTAAAKNLKPGEVRIKNAAANPLDASGATPDEMSGNWRVRKIWGQGAGMHAQLSNGTGTLLNVIKGDPLPDGKVVETVSVRGVTISQNGKISDLSWDEMNSSGSANAAQTSP